MNPYGAYTDFVCPKFAVAAILAAVDRQRATGLGTHLDMSQLETSLHFGGPMLLDAAVNGREPDLVGNRHPSASPHGAYPCAPDAHGESDRWVAIAAFTDEQWAALRGEMAADGVAEIESGEFRTFRVRKGPRGQAGRDHCGLDGASRPPRVDEPAASGGHPGGCGQRYPRPVRGSATAPSGAFHLVGPPRDGAVRHRLYRGAALADPGPAGPSGAAAGAGIRSTRCGRLWG